MINRVKIAIDAMGGDNAPKKIIDGINISLQSNQENFFFLYGQQDLLEKEIAKNKLVQQNCEIINTKDVINDDESPLAAAKKGKESSMWKAIESQKEKHQNLEEIKEDLIIELKVQILLRIKSQVSLDFRIMLI